jgi:hypothetical protein
MGVTHYEARRNSTVVVTYLSCGSGKARRMLYMQVELQAEYQPAPGI